MFDVSKIQAGLYGVVGFRQPLNPDYDVLDADNIISRSGKFVTDNPNCKVEFIYDNQDYKDISDANFNLILKRMQQDSIANVCHRVFNRPDYIDRQVLYPYAQNRVNTESLVSGLYCFKIKVADDKNIAFEITRVMLDFSGTGTIELLLFNTSQTAPIQSQSVVVTSNHQVVTLNWKIDNSGSTYKGDYYFGYRTNTASIGTLTPFKRDYENSDIMAQISGLDVEKFCFVGHAANTLPDLTTESSVDVCIGLNPDINVYEDYTDLILRNESLLANAINLDLQIKCIEMQMASLRSNVTERKAELNLIRLIQIVEGVNETESAVKITGLRPELSRAINGIKNEIDKLIHGYFGERAMIDTLA